MFESMLPHLCTDKGAIFCHASEEDQIQIEKQEATDRF
jgi:hypothetical protein